MDDAPSDDELRTALRRASGRIAELEVALEHAERDLAALASSAARFRGIFEHSNDAVFVVDLTDDEIVDVNPKACRLLGYHRAELLAVPMSIVHPHDMARVRGFADEVNRRGDGFIGELTCVTKSGERVSVEMSASVFELDGRRAMVAMLRDMSERDRLRRQNDYLQGELRQQQGLGRVVGASRALAEIQELVSRVAVTDSTVLITGESGTGKELIAHAIHEHSRRASGPFVRVNCPSIPSELFESEFFGHVKGAFTGALAARVGRFELADGGTIFLDEIGEIPLGLQSKLLRVLQEGEIDRVGEGRNRKVDVRVVAATNRDLLAEARDGRFREDLYYRLNIFPIAIPPLRERPEDILDLVAHFQAEAAARLGVPVPRLAAADREALLAYPWPGNVREVRNVIERATILAGDGVLRLALPDQPRGAEAAPMAADARPRRRAVTAPPPDQRLTLDDLKRLERELVTCALEEADWRIYGEDGAAARLGIPPTTLASRIKKMDLHRPRR